MKKLVGVSLSLILILPAAAWAQLKPQAPASWVEFQKQEQQKMDAFMAQIRADRQAFISTHPDVKTYFDEVNAQAKQKLADWKAAHPRI